MVIQVIIRMTLYLDQAIVRNQQVFHNESIHGIQNTVFIERNSKCVSNCDVFFPIHFVLALSMRRVLHDVGICSYGHVHVDVYRRSIPSQCGYVYRVSGTFSAHAICDAGLGCTSCYDRYLGCIHCHI